MRVLVIGGGAREHALVWKLMNSRDVRRIYCAPGNAGTSLMAHNITAPASLNEFASWAVREAIDLVVVGPEGPLIAGLANTFRSRRIDVFGPTREAARIEGSKSWAKALMERHGIPCARGKAFDASEETAAVEYAMAQPLPVVIKADGEAFGKGVVVAHSKEQALVTIGDFLLRNTLGPAGQRIVIEEGLSGREVSILAFVDGDTVVPMTPACDYKRLEDNDQGPNTGGMGAFAPPPLLNRADLDDITTRILKPVVAAMAAEGYPYQGVLYAGLMLTADGPKVLEFNARFGDPEAQVILPLLKTDIVDVMLACVRGRLADMPIDWEPGATCGVVMAAKGYPGEYRRGMRITGLDELDSGVLAFHAGTNYLPGHKLVASGGRVLTVVARGDTLAEAREKVYANVTRIQFDNAHYRTDVGLLPSP